MKCQRCGDPKPFVTSCSYFNTQTICGVCSDKERAHPAYQQAREAEAEACARGDYRFPGIGLPADLR